MKVYPINFKGEISENYFEDLIKENRVKNLKEVIKEREKQLEILIKSIENAKKRLKEMESEKNGHYNTK